MQTAQWQSPDTGVDGLLAVFCKAIHVILGDELVGTYQ